MQGQITIGGLSSGLQVDDIIEKLKEFERRPIDRYGEQQKQLRSRLTAFQDANTRLLAVRDAADQLASSTFFSQRTATSSNAETLSATADVGAAAGEYALSIESLARAHQMKSASFADLDSTTVGTGTLTITAGSDSATITVDSSNNTLRGLRDAINAADAGVRASIIQDGDNSYRLMIASKETGTANAITLNSSLSGGTDPAFTDLQTAEDAEVKLGSGATAITITRSTNAIRDLIPGVTLNLTGADPGKALTVKVTQDDAKIQEGVQKLVDQYNNAVDFVNKQFSYNGETGQGGVLLGDYTLRNAQSELARVFTSTVPGVSEGARSLADLGLTFNGDGKLAFNTATFQQQLAEDPEGVARVFALTAESTHTGVQFVSAESQTKLDGSAYAVSITQAARQARVTAGAAQTGTLDADETLTINGKTVTLTSGMTQAEVIAAINARRAETGVVAAATGADGTGSGSYLTFRSAGYGSSASVSVLSSRSSAAGSTTGIGSVTATHASAGGETGSGTGEAGLDVAGVINGEAATGKGQLLTGNDGNATTDGLQLRITATTTGSLGTITLYDGVTSAAVRSIDILTDAKTGPIQGEEDNLQTRIDYLDEIIGEREEALQRHEGALRLKFARLEEALAQYQSQSSYLSSQLRSL